MRPLHQSLCGRAMLLCSLAAAGSPRLAAQSATATLTGVVRAARGSAIVGASVEIRSPETGSARQATTDVAGAYRVLGLAPGTYDVTARALGHRAERRSEIDLVVGALGRVDFTLDATDAVDLPPVVVSATAASQVAAERADVSTVVVQKELERLPLNSRNALVLAGIAPGVRSYGASATAGAMNSTRFVNLYVDGAEWKGFATGELVAQPGAGSLIPQEAIREYRISLNPYDAEYTHGGSWVMSAVTHQGGNEREGSVFAYGQSRDLIARGAFDRTKPAYHRGQAGGNLRGPIVRDRLFFSASYEGQLTDNYLNVAPSAPPYAPALWDGYAGSFVSPTRNHTGMARLTALYGSHTIDAIWLGRQLTTVSSFGVQVGGLLQSHEAAVSSSYRVASGQLRDRWVTGAFVNELALQVLDDHQSDAPLVPGVTVQYPSIQVRGRTSYPLIGDSRHITVAERASYTARGIGGEHVLKGGVELGSVHGSIFQPTSKDGLFRFPQDTATKPSLGQIGVGFLHPTTTEDALVPLGGNLGGAYVQDQWRPDAIPSLDLIAGVRYDVELDALDQRNDGPWAGDTTLQRVVGSRYLDPRHRRSNLANFAPRIAAAWTPGGSGRTSLRGGYGVMYDITPRLPQFSEQVSWSWRVYAFTNPGTTDPAELRRRVLAGGGRAVPNLTLLPDHMATPSSRQWSIGGGERLGDHLALQVDYLDQHLRHLPVTVKVNGVVNGARPRTSRYGDITLWGDFGDAVYHGLLTSLTFERGPTRWTAAYTLAWARSEFTDVPDAGYGDSAAYSMQPNPADERHRIVVSAMTQAAFGLQFAAVGTVASPRPFAIVSGSDVNLDGTSADDFPDGERTSRRAGWSHWYRNLDLRVGKSFGGPRPRVTGTAEVFNAFNTGNHSSYVAIATSPGYRQPFADFARRQAQVGLRYEF